MSPTFTIGDKGYADFDFLTNDEIQIDIKPFNKIKIQPELGKTQKILIYLEDISYQDCYNYQEAFRKSNENKNFRRNQ